MRKCSQCLKYLDAAMFRLTRHGNPKRICRPCESAQNLNRYHGNPNTKSAHRAASRRYTLKQYGLTPDDFDRMRKEVDFRCAICSTPEDETRFGTLNVDHNHTTGEVRGLLCHHCNSALGHFREDIEIFLKAIAYLESHQSRVQEDYL